MIHIYEAHAKDFDKVRGRTLMERDYLERVTDLAPTPADLLDLGCGAGEPIARYFIDRGYTVTGLDAAPSMLAICRERFPQMTWLQGDMRSLELNARFDVIVAWNSFFHLAADAQRSMFARFKAWSRPNTVLLFTSGFSEGEAIGEMFGHSLYHASLDTAEYASLLDAHGFSVIEHRVEDPTCGGHTVWLAHRDGRRQLVG